MSEAFVSYAQNAEDVVLWRALGHVAGGSYLDVGAAHPTDDSVTAAFYERGWRGLNVEPVPELAAALRAARPRDVTVEAAAGAHAESGRVLWVIAGTGLSTLVGDEAARSVALGHQAAEVAVAVRTLDDLLVEAGFEGSELHFCKIDVEGAEAEVLAGLDLRRWRPWVVVVEATRPNSTELAHNQWEPYVLQHGYRFVLFDGLNRFYVAEEHPELLEVLRAPANATDGPWERADRMQRRQEFADQVAGTEARAETVRLAALAERAHADQLSARREAAAQRVRYLRADVLQWQRRARAEEEAEAEARRRTDSATELVVALRQTVSWRVTEPIRQARPLVVGAAGRLHGRHEPQDVPPEEPPPTEVEEAADTALVAPPTLIEQVEPVEPAELAETVPDAVFARRVAVAAALLAGSPTSDSDTDDPAAAVAHFIAAADTTASQQATVSWLAFLAARGAHPTELELDEVLRVVLLDGAAGVAEWMTARWRADQACGAASAADLKVLDSGVLVDVTHTSGHDLHTGVQRVVREAGVRWHDAHGAVLFAWDYEAGFPAGLDEEQLDRFRSWRLQLANGPTEPAERNRQAAVLVPWQATVIVPEIAVEPGRAERYRALARSGVLHRFAAIGHDLIPITATETVGFSMSEDFTEFLSVLKYAERVAAVSGSSAREFAGFAQMLRSQGLGGACVRACPLPTEVPSVPPAAFEHARELLMSDALPLVVVVGSHEPRKNHVTVLVAAESLWRSGHVFQLVLIGGSGWQSDSFDLLLAELQSVNRPVRVLKRADEDTLWTAFRLARFTVFPSLTEGYGLPVAESLASGTPVVTSSFGSMAEIGQGAGALLVDPRNVGAVEEAMARLLDDDALLSDLRAEAAARRWKTWDEYAEETWHHLVESA